MTESLPLPETVEIEVLPEDYEKAVFYDKQRKTGALLTGVPETCPLAIAFERTLGLPATHGVSTARVYPDGPFAKAAKRTERGVLYAPLNRVAVDRYTLDFDAADVKPPYARFKATYFRLDPLDPHERFERTRPLAPKGTPDD